MTRFKRYCASCLVIFAVSMACTCALLIWARGNAGMVESLYARGIYPTVHFATSWMAAWLPFSLAEIIVILLALFALVLCFAVIYLALKRERELIIKMALAILAVAGVMWFGFYALWGLNYYRHTLYESLAIENKRHSVQQLYDICAILQKQAETAREKLPINPDGTAQLPDPDQIIESIPEIFEKLSQKYPLFDQPVNHPKAIMLSAPMSHTGISGIYIPYTQEANINVDQYPLLLAATACHETAHSLGFAREDEANFIAYLACMNSDDPAFQYSGAMLALIYASNSLYRIDPEAHSSLRKEYTSGMACDLANYQSFWKAREGEVSKKVGRVNDRYLKANGQSGGVASYGDMVDLLLASVDAGIIERGSEQEAEVILMVQSAG